MTLASLRYLGLGAAVTIELALAAVVLSTAIGLPLALTRLYAWGPVREAAALYGLVIRGIPLLILLLGSYFSLPYLGINLPLSLVVIVTMGLYFGAYMGEVFRTAIATVSSKQWDAGRSVGFRRLDVFRIVILPQALRLCIAPWLNIALGVVKSTSLVTAIGGWELVAAGREVGERTGDVLPAYLAIAAAYFLICLPLSRLGSVLERLVHA